MSFGLGVDWSDAGPFSYSIYCVMSSYYTLCTVYDSIFSHLAAARAVPPVNTCAITHTINVPSPLQGQSMDPQGS